MDVTHSLHSSDASFAEFSSNKCTLLREFVADYQLIHKNHSLRAEALVNSLPKDLRRDLPQIVTAWPVFSAFSSKMRKQIREKQIVYRKGKWRKSEEEILEKNFSEYWNDYKQYLNSPEQLFWKEFQSDVSISDLNKFRAKTYFYFRLARNLNRPLVSVAFRAKQKFHTFETGKLTPDEQKEIERLKMLHGPRWSFIGAALNRRASVVSQPTRVQTGRTRTGKWTHEEDQQLIRAIKRVTHIEEITVCHIKLLPWEEISCHVPTRNARQCSKHWETNLALKLQTEAAGKPEVPEKWQPSVHGIERLELKLKFLEYLVLLDIDDENDIDWHGIADSLGSSLSFCYLRIYYHRKKRNILNAHNKSVSEILDYLSEVEIPRLKKRIERRKLRQSFAAGDSSNEPTE